MFATSGGVRIYYETEGRGPAIIFHTGAGGDHRIWRHAGYVAALRGYRKILMDQRGRGESDRPATIESHRFDKRVSDVVSVLDDAGVESAAFVGYSSGAVVGVGFGSASPRRLKGLVGIGTLPYGNYSERPKPPDIQAYISQIVSVGGVKADVERFMRIEKDRFPDSIRENVLSGDPLMRALDGAAALEWQGPLDAYQKLSAPVLMIAGEKEDPERETEKSITKIPNGRLVRLPGLGHLSAFYRSDVTLPLIRPFLRGCLGA